MIILILILLVGVTTMFSVYMHYASRQYSNRYIKFTTIFVFMLIILMTTNILFAETLYCSSNPDGTLVSWDAMTAAINEIEVVATATSTSINIIPEQVLYEGREAIIEFAITTLDWRLQEGLLYGDSIKDGFTERECSIIIIKFYNTPGMSGAQFGEIIFDILLKQIEK